MRGSKKKRGQSYADASELPLSPEFRNDFAACAGKDWANVKGVWGYTTLPWTSGQLQMQSKRGATKYGWDPMSAQEISSNPILTLIYPWSYPVLGRETEYYIKIGIQSVASKLAQIMYSSMISKCLGICVATRSLLLVAPETSTVGLIFLGWCTPIIYRY